MEIHADLDPISLFLEVTALRQRVDSLLAQIRQLEAERDTWQRQAVNND